MSEIYALPGCVPGWQDKVRCLEVVRPDDRRAGSHRGLCCTTSCSIQRSKLDSRKSGENEMVWSFIASMTCGIFRLDKRLPHGCLVRGPGIPDCLCSDEDAIVGRGAHHVRVGAEFGEVCLLEAALGISNCTGGCGVGREPALDDGSFAVLPEVLVELGIVIVLDIEEDRVQADILACLRDDRGAFVRECRKVDRIRVCCLDQRSAGSGSRSRPS